MELDLTPKLPKQVYGGDGGSYFAWCPEELPMLKEGNIGAANLALKQYGFAVPRYSDSPRLSMFFKVRILSLFVLYCQLFVCIMQFCIICLIDFIFKKFYK